MRLSVQKKLFTCKMTSTKGFVTIFPMRTLATSGGDLVFGVTDGLQSVIDRVVQRLLFIRGEWFLNTAAGVPYLQDVLGTAHNEELAQRTFINEIEGVPDVTSVTDFQFLLGQDAADDEENPNRDPRPLLFRATIDTLFGTAEITI